jgi:hypothetical protein
MFRIVVRVNARLMFAGRLEIKRDGVWQVCGVFQLSGREWRRMRRAIKANGVEVIHERKKSAVPA